MSDKKGKKGNLDKIRTLQKERDLLKISNTNLNNISNWRGEELKKIPAWIRWFFKAHYCD